MTSNPSSSADQPLKGTTVPGSVPVAPKSYPSVAIRAAAAWSALIVGFLILILLIFIACTASAHCPSAGAGSPLGVAICWRPWAAADHRLPAPRGSFCCDVRQRPTRRPSLTGHP